MKNSLEEPLRSFMTMLYNLKKTGKLPNNIKQEFLNLLVASKESFIRFYDHQEEMFQRLCSYYLDGFSTEEICKLYSTISDNVFTDDKSTYSSLVDTKVKEFKSSLGNENLKALWKEKTKSISPRQWSKDHRMPILCLIPDAGQQDARAAFAAVNDPHPNTTAIERAIAYLREATFYPLLDAPEVLDEYFKNKIIKNYVVMLSDVEEVKQYLDRQFREGHLRLEPYDWYDRSEVERKLQKMAEAKYSEAT